MRDHLRRCFILGAFGAWLAAGAPALAAAQQAAAPLAAPRAALKEELRLDANAEDFSAVGRIYVGPRRTIVVPLAQDAQIRLYDSTGKPIAVVGRRGDGPGEFQAMSLAGWAADTLWVYDVRARRSTYIAPDGDVLRTVAMPNSFMPQFTEERSPGRLQFFFPVAVFTDGSFLGDARYEVEQRPGRSYQWSTRQTVRAFLNGSVRPIATPPLFEDERWYMTVGGLGNPVPFAALPQTVYAGDASRFAYLTTDITSNEGGTVTASMFRSTGDTMFVRSFRFQGERIPQRRVDSALAAMIPSPGAARDGPANAPQQFQAIAREKMPPVYAPVANIAIGLDETLWITLRATAEGQIAVMLDARGRPVKSVVVPQRSRIWQATATQLWMTEADADGLQSVVRYAVTGGM